MRGRWDRTKARYLAEHYRFHRITGMWIHNREENVNESEKPYNIIDCSQVDVKSGLKRRTLLWFPLEVVNNMAIICHFEPNITARWLRACSEEGKCPHTPHVWCGYSPQHMREAGKGQERSH